MTRSFWSVMLLLAASCSTPEQPDRLRVIDFNVFVGFRRGAAEDEAAAWIAAQQPDVVAFQELVGFTKERLEDLARSWGHPYAELGTGKNGRYLGLGLTSRFPIEETRVITRKGVKLGVLHGRTRGIDFFVLHLGHGPDAVRLQETRTVIAAIEEIQSVSRPSILLGDFNSTSRVDDEFYASHDAKMIELGKGSVYAVNPAKFDIMYHGSMDQYLSAGWVDVVHQHQGVLTEEQASWPSLVFKDSENHIRIDFILASPSLAKKCTSARVMKEPATDHLSDHYPVMADFDWP